MKSDPERAFDTTARSRYRTVWSGVTAFVAAVSAVVGSVTVGWAPLAVTAICMAVLGDAFGAAWVDDLPARRPAAIRGAWYGAGGALTVSGLPAAIGGWAMAVLVGLAATAPPVVDAVLNELGKKREELQADDLGRLTERDLARLWRTTYDAVSSSSSSAGQRLRVAQQRARLLDELERRDPRRFRAWLTASAHTPPSTRPQNR